MDEEPSAGKLPLGSNDPVILMDNVVDMLKLLDYENKFCK